MKTYTCKSVLRRQKSCSSRPFLGVPQTTQSYAPIKLWNNLKKDCDEFFAKQQQIAEDFLGGLEEKVNTSIKEEVSRQVAVVQQPHLDAQMEAQQLKEMVKQLEKGLIRLLLPAPPRPQP